jgi:hypothetical protein
MGVFNRFGIERRGVNQNNAAIIAKNDSTTTTKEGVESMSYPVV